MTLALVLPGSSFIRLFRKGRIGFPVRRMHRLGCKLRPSSGTKLKNVPPEFVPNQRNTNFQSMCMPASTFQLAEKAPGWVRMRAEHPAGA
jgi:hypothetical protein